MSERVKLTKAQDRAMKRFGVLAARSAKDGAGGLRWLPANCESGMATPATARRLVALGLLQHVNPGARFESVAFKSVAMFDLTDAGRAYLAEGKA